MEARPMRRKDRAISLEEAQAVLREATYGTLSIVSSAGEPYGVPLSFVYEGGALYFHCAKVGHKIDCLRANPQASFVAVNSADAVYSGSFTMNFRSAMLGGTATELPEGGEKHDALMALCRKYLPEYMEKAEHAITSTADQTAVWKIAPDWITGKAKLG